MTKKEENQLKRANQRLLEFRGLCDEYGIDFQNRYSCMQSLAETVRGRKNRISNQERKAFPKILIRLLYVDSYEFEQYDRWDKGKPSLNEYDLEECQKILRREKDVNALQKHFEVQEMIALKLDYLAKSFDRIKRRREQESAAQEQKQGTRLAVCLLTVLKYYLASYELQEKKEPEEELQTLSQKSVKEIEKYLPDYLEDGCFVEVLPYFLFFHLATARGMIKKTDYNDILTMWNKPFSIFTKDRDGYYLNREVPWLIGNNCRHQEYANRIEDQCEDVVAFYRMLRECCEEVLDCLNYRTFGTTLQELCSDEEAVRLLRFGHPYLSSEMDCFTSVLIGRRCAVHRFAKVFKSVPSKVQASDVKCLSTDEITHHLEENWNNYFHSFTRSVKKNSSVKEEIKRKYDAYAKDEKGILYKYRKEPIGWGDALESFYELVNPNTYFDPENDSFKLKNLYPAAEKMCKIGFAPEKKLYIKIDEYKKAEALAGFFSFKGASFLHVSDALFCDITWNLFRRSSNEINDVVGGYIYESRASARFGLRKDLYQGIGKRLASIEKMVKREGAHWCGFRMTDGQYEKACHMASREKEFSKLLKAFKSREAIDEVSSFFTRAPSRSDVLSDILKICSKNENDTCFEYETDLDSLLSDNEDDVTCDYDLDDLSISDILETNGLLTYKKRKEQNKDSEEDDEDKEEVDDDEDDEVKQIMERMHDILDKLPNSLKAHRFDGNNRNKKNELRFFYLFMEKVLEGFEYQFLYTAEEMITTLLP